MTTNEKFKKALIEMKETGELEKILNNAPEDEKEKVESDIMVIKKLAEVGPENVSVIPVLMSLQSVEIFKDALCFMTKYDRIEKN